MDRVRQRRVKFRRRCKRRCAASEVPREIQYLHVRRIIGGRATTRVGGNLLARLAARPEKYLPAFPYIVVPFGPERVGRSPGQRDTLSQTGGMRNDRDAPYIHALFAPRQCRAIAVCSAAEKFSGFGNLAPVHQADIYCSSSRDREVVSFLVYVHIHTCRVLSPRVRVDGF